MLATGPDTEEKGKWKGEGSTVPSCGILSRRWDLYTPGGSIWPECLLPRGHLLISLDSQVPHGGDVSWILLLLVREVT